MFGRARLYRCSRCVNMAKMVSRINGARMYVCAGHFLCKIKRFDELYLCFGCAHCIPNADRMFCAARHHNINVFFAHNSNGLGDTIFFSFLERRNKLADGFFLRLAVWKWNFRLTLSSTRVTEEAESYIRFGWSIPEVNNIRRQMCGLADNVINIVIFNRFSGFFGEGTPDVMGDANANER